MTTMNFLASADTSPAASAFGVSDEAGEDVDLVADDQFLREPLGDVGRDAAGILADDLDLLAADRVAVLLHVGLDAVVHLDAGVGKRPDSVMIRPILMVSWALADGAPASSIAATPPIAVVIKRMEHLPEISWRCMEHRQAPGECQLGVLSLVRGPSAAAVPYFIRAFTGSLTFSTLSISTLRKPSGVFSTFWM